MHGVDPYAAFWHSMRVCCWALRSSSRGQCFRLLACIVRFAQPGAAENSVLSATLEWPPYVSQHLEHYGFTSEIVAQAFTRLGYTVQMHFMPWERALRKVAEGKDDAPIQPTMLPKEPTGMVFSQLFSAGPTGYLHNVLI